MLYCVLYFDKDNGILGIMDFEFTLLIHIITSFVTFFADLLPIYKHLIHDLKK